MKRLIFICSFAAFISIIYGNFIFNIYKNNMEKVLETVSLDEKVYMILYGSYNSKDKINMNIKDYIVIENNNFYEVYVGITKDLENANKIKGVFKDLGNSVYIREKTINNLEFIDYLDSMDVDLAKKTNDEILKLEKNILLKYKELNE